jgi:adenylate cyclase
MITSQTFGQAQLDHLLQQWRSSHLIDRARLEQEIWLTFGQTKAVLILDMCGFSKTTSHQGIIAALAKIQHMNAIVQPTLLAHRGLVLKSEADNIFAIFDHPLEAIAASHASYQMVQAEGLSVAIGIGYGPILLIPGAIGYNDFFGDEVNLASKLGEDTAVGGELWLTEAAYHSLGASLETQSDLWEEHYLSISDIEMTAYRAAL